MSDSKENVPDTIPPEPSRGFGELAREVQDIQRRLREGDRQFAENRTARERAQEALAAQRIEAVTATATLRLDVERALEKLRREVVTDWEKHLAEQVGLVRADIEERAPKMSLLKVAAWISGVIVPVLAAIWFAAKYPDRGEYRDLENRIRVLEARVTEVVARFSKP